MTRPTDLALVVEGAGGEPVADRRSCHAELARHVRCDRVEAPPTEVRKPVEPVTEKRALVIGGGIAGIQAALDLANARIRVTLVEKSPTLGGRMAQLDKTFPTMDCSI